MAAPAATVLVPTHDHGPLLTVAVGSALGQSVEAIEVFIVCDGATEDTLGAAEALRDADDRVRLFIHDKGLRHGELYRHDALQEASGDIVCYLSDDDLWLPSHVASMAELLESADFAHSLPFGVLPDGRIISWAGHFSVPGTVEKLHQGQNFIPLPCAGHTLELYHHLPYGWRTTPAGTPTDLYMWQQIISVDGVRLSSGNEPTVLHFPSSKREGMTIGERLEELQRWSDAASQPDFIATLQTRIGGALKEAWAASDVRNRALAEDARHTGERLAALEAGPEAAMADRDTLVGDLANAEEGASKANEALAEVTTRLADERVRSERAAGRIASLEAQLARITRSRTWRLCSGLLGIPGVAWLARKAGGARSR